MFDAMTLALLKIYIELVYLSAIWSVQPYLGE